MAMLRNLTRFTTIGLTISFLVACENNPSPADSEDTHKTFTITQFQNDDGTVELLARNFEDPSTRIEIGKLEESSRSLSVSINTNTENEGYELLLFVERNERNEVELKSFDYDQATPSFRSTLLEIDPTLVVCNLEPIQVSDKVVTSTSSNFEELAKNDTGAFIELANEATECGTSDSQVQRLTFTYTASTGAVDNITLRPAFDVTSTFIDPTFVDEQFTELDEDGFEVVRQRKGRLYEIQQVNDSSIVQLVDEQQTIQWTSELNNLPNEFSFDQISDSQVLFRSGDIVNIVSIEDITINPDDTIPDLSNPQVINTALYATQEPLLRLQAPNTFKLVSNALNTIILDNNIVYAVDIELNRTELIDNSFPIDAELTIAIVNANVVAVLSKTPTSDPEEFLVRLSAYTKQSSGWSSETLLPSSTAKAATLRTAQSEVFINTCDLQGNGLWQAHYASGSLRSLSTFFDAMILTPENIEASITNKNDSFLILDEDATDATDCELTNPEIFRFDASTTRGIELEVNEDDEIIATDTSGVNQAFGKTFGRFDGRLSDIDFTSVKRSGDAVSFYAQATKTESGSANPELTAFIFDASLSIADPEHPTSSEIRRQLKAFQLGD